MQEYADRIREHLHRLTKQQRRRLLAALLLAGVAIGWWASLDAYTLENRYRQAVVSGTMSAGGHQFEVGRLEPGQRITYRYWPGQDTRLRFRVVLADGTVITDSVDVGKGPFLGGRATTTLDPDRGIVLVLGW